MSGDPEERIYTVVKANVIKHPLSNDEVFPVEFSMAAFSLKRGVIESYTAIIEPLPLPSGSAYNARVLKDDTDLPLPGVESDLFSESSQDYGTIAANVKRMIFMHLPTSTGRLTKKVVFCMTSDFPAAAGTFRWLGANCNDSTLGKFLVDIEILDLSRLFYRLSLFVNSRNPSFSNGMTQFHLVAVGEKQLNRPNAWSFRNEITCPFHCKAGSNKMDMCAKNWVLRRIFTILKEFVDVLGLKGSTGHNVETYPSANFAPKIEFLRTKSVINENKLEFTKTGFSTTPTEQCHLRFICTSFLTAVFPSPH
ncbi:unnamed protein product [Allacma fusca]|uniref:Maelstrom domain-containing protein n=1 Tax=Allacma fusca TaxID=39272 RepID=A0A8J2LK04_9HEXA|nr:unnamed protein product [Allacma fusca]